MKEEILRITEETTEEMKKIEPETAKSYFNGLMTAVRILNRELKDPEKLESALADIQDAYNHPDAQPKT